MISPPPGATLTDTRVPYTTLCRSGDSGKVSGAGFSARPDRDLKIAAQTPYWWAVMLWSDDGKASTWSAPERFITGVTEGWQATWIAADKGWPVHIAESRKGADNPGPKVMPLFRRGFTVGKPVRQSGISIRGLGPYQLRINE